MAAPTVTARGTPNQPQMKEGYRTEIAFSVDPKIRFYEIGVKPPAVDGGDAIKQTTMFNNNWHTKRPRSLKDLDDGTVMAAYSANCIEDAMNLVNVEGSVTWHFPDNSTLAAWAYMRKFEPADLKEGELPTATVTITITNVDPSNGSEAGPVFAPATGT